MDFIIFQSFLWSVLSQTKSDRAIIVVGDELSLKLHVDILCTGLKIFSFGISNIYYTVWRTDQATCQAMSEQQGGQRKPQSRDFFS